MTSSHHCYLTGTMATAARRHRVNVWSSGDAEGLPREMMSVLPSIDMAMEALGGRVVGVVPVGVVPVGVVSGDLGVVSVVGSTVVTSGSLRASSPRAK